MLDAIADDLGRSRSEIIHEAVLGWLKKNTRGYDHVPVVVGMVTGIWN